jgi:hypothetical protein
LEPGNALQIRQLEPEDSCIEALVFSPDAELVVCQPFRIVDSAGKYTLFREDEKEREVVWNGAISRGRFSRGSRA